MPGWRPRKAPLWCSCKMHFLAKWSTPKWPNANRGMPSAGCFAWWKRPRLRKTSLISPFLVRRMPLCPWTSNTSGRSAQRWICTAKSERWKTLTPCTKDLCPRPWLGTTGTRWSTASLKSGTIWTPTKRSTTLDWGSSTAARGGRSKTSMATVDSSMPLSNRPCTTSDVGAKTPGYQHGILPSARGSFAFWLFARAMPTTDCLSIWSRHPTRHWTWRAL